MAQSLARARVATVGALRGDGFCLPRERADVVAASVEDILRSPLRVVALRDLDPESLARSASGGAFSVLARPVLESGGVVFGAEAQAGGVVRPRISTPTKNRA